MTFVFFFQLQKIYLPENNNDNKTRRNENGECVNMPFLYFTANEKLLRVCRHLITVYTHLFVKSDNILDRLVYIFTLIRRYLVTLFMELSKVTHCHNITNVPRLSLSFFPFIFDHTILYSYICTYYVKKIFLSSKM